MRSCNNFSSFKSLVKSKLRKGVPPQKQEKTVVSSSKEATDMLSEVWEGGYNNSWWGNQTVLKKAPTESSRVLDYSDAPFTGKGRRASRNGGRIMGVASQHRI
jgi:hypothetical protein